MPDDGSIGAGSGRFPITRFSAVLGARSGDEAERRRSIETLIAVYWKPVYTYLRLRWRRGGEDAKDLTQGFFLRALEKDFFAGYEPAKGRFRTFLRACLDRYVANQDQAESRLKRGGSAPAVPLEFAAAEADLAAARATSARSPEESFDAEWVRSLFGLAIEALRADCAASGKEVHFRLFERYDLEDAGAGRATYETLAAEFHLPVTQVTNHLAFARRELRRHLLLALREITGSDEEYRREARLLLGTEPQGEVK